MFKKARKEGKKSKQSGNNVSNSLLENWNILLYQSKCDATSRKVHLKKVGL